MLKIRDFNDVKVSQLEDFFHILKRHRLIGELNNRDIDPDYCIALLHTQKERILGAILEDESGTIQGIFIGAIGYQWFDPSTSCVNEMMLFLMPEYRRGGHFKQLLDYMESVCKDRHIGTLQVGNAMKIEPDRFQAVLNHYNFSTSPVYRKQL